MSDDKRDILGSGGLLQPLTLAHRQRTESLYREGWRAYGGERQAPFFKVESTPGKLPEGEDYDPVLVKIEGTSPLTMRSLYGDEWGWMPPDYPGPAAPIRVPVVVENGKARPPKEGEELTGEALLTRSPPNR